jgi:spermidine synthase
MQEETITLARSDAEGYEIALRRRFEPEGITDELIVNGTFAMDSSQITSEIALAEAMGPRPGHVLVGGLGLGYTARHLLTMGAARLDIVELAGPLIDWARQGLTPTLLAVANDPRVSIRQGDIAGFLYDQPAIPGIFGPWDGICLDIDNGPDFLIHEGNSRLYTPLGIRSILDHLNPGGRLAVWCHGPSKEFWFDLTSLDPNATERLVAVERGNRRMDYAIYTIHRRDAD